MKLMQVYVQKSRCVLDRSYHFGCGPRIVKNMLMKIDQRQVSQNFSSNCIMNCSTTSHILMGTDSFELKQPSRFLSSCSDDKASLMYEKLREKNLSLTLLRNYSSMRKRSDQVDREKRRTPEVDDAVLDRYTMLRLTSENDILSRCRNSYIMTLVALSALQAEFLPLSLTISGVAVVTAGLNLMFGTCSYLLNIFNLWKGEKISSVVFASNFFWAILHFILWSLVLVMLLPSGKKFDDELKKYISDNE